MKNNPLTGISLIIYLSMLVNNKVVYQVTIYRRHTTHCYLVKARRAGKVELWVNHMLDRGHGRLRARYDGWDFEI